MLAWMICALPPAVALSLAALLAEQAARQRHAPSRWIWVAALASSLLFPLVGPALLEIAPVRLPLPPLPVALREVQSLGAPLSLDALLRNLWWVLSAVMLGLLAGAALVLRRRARGWRRARLGGTDVYVAASAGPAVFGWWRPQIVLPEWLAQAPARQRELALAHEQSHLDAYDPQLLAIALALLAIMPWNLPLWWQLHRLRCAIEVDCDARVLRGGGDLMDYGETLIELSQHQRRQLGLLAATAQPLSFLERRIRIMSSQPGRWSRVAAGALLCLALGVVAVAAELTPPQMARAMVPAAPPAPAMPAIPPVPAVPAVPEVAPADVHVATLEEAKEEAESAAERAEEAKNDAEEAEAEAHEAMRDAEEQMTQATAAKREAEAAAAEAKARKQEAEAASHAEHAGDGSPH